ncbi:hypothetical protein DFJ74DRAFT_712648 [Hyaloraphidium curvatum]|nr:hypothetical protein DFJ74DRAFT_712648 [Hyaloraphidium curvatum]
METVPAPAADAIRLELDGLNRELQLLLQTTVPTLIVQLTNLLKASMDIAKDASGSTVLAVSSSNTDALKGFVTVNGTMITKAEIKLKMPQYKSQLPPYNLARQLTLVQELTKLLDNVKRAKLSISRLDEKATFPQKECDTKAFNPELPDDLIIEFYVNRSSIVVSAIALHSQNKLLNRLRSGTGRVFVEAVEEILVEATYPKLATLVSNLTVAEDICASLLERLSVLPDPVP